MHNLFTILGLTVAGMEWGTAVTRRSDWNRDRLVL